MKGLGDLQLFFKRPRFVSSAPHVYFQWHNGASTAALQVSPRQQEEWTEGDRKGGKSTWKSIVAIELQFRIWPLISDPQI